MQASGEKVLRLTALEPGRATKPVWDVARDAERLSWKLPWLRILTEPEVDQRAHVQFDGAKIQENA